MNRPSTMRRDAYDVIVVGSGMGGMTASALLSKAGKSVLLVEAQPDLGGYAHAFHRGPYTIDPAVHSILDPALFDDLLRYLDVRDCCEFVSTDTLYGAQFPGMFIAAPATSVDDLIEVYAERFPSQAAEIEQFIRLCETIQREGHEVSESTDTRDLDDLVRRFPTLFRFARATLGEVLDEVFTDRQIGYAVSVMSEVLGLPPRKLSFQTFAQMLVAYIVSGAFYAQGGSGKIVDALADAIRMNGADIVVGNRVVKILLERDRVAGVRLEDGTEIRALTVVSNADVTEMIDELIGAEHLPQSYVRSVRRLKPSSSGFCILAASTMDFRNRDAQDITLYHEGWNIDDLYGQSNDERVTGYAMYIPSLVDSTLAPPGQYVLSVLTPLPYDIGQPWSEAKGRYREAMLAAAERQYPGFRDSLVFDEVSTPLTLERFSRNHQGAIWGWENSPIATGSKRPSQRSPIEGLYLVGHWTQPGCGFARVTISGIIASRLVLNQDGAVSSTGMFQSESLPGIV